MNKKRNIQINNKVIQNIISKTNLIKLEVQDFKELLDKKADIEIYDIVTETTKDTDRESSLRKELEKLNLQDYKTVYFVIETSNKYPLLVTELRPISEFLSNIRYEEDISWGIGINDEQTREISVTIICSKS